MRRSTEAIVDQVGKLLKPDSLARRSQDSLTTSQKSSEPSEPPPWAELLLQIAQDKRHDLAPGILQLWKVKLQSYKAWEINEALMLYAGEFFPSVDDITAMMNRGRTRRAEAKHDQTETEAKQDREAIERYKLEHDGKTPSQVFVDENREWIRRMDMNLMGGSPNSERNKKALDQSRVLGCEAK